MMREPRLLVVGGASRDVLHFSGQTASSAGGAGLYTALAAARAGARVTMYAPRPDPMPEELAPALAVLEWVGPTVPPEALDVSPSKIGLNFDLTQLGFGIFGFLLVIMMILRPQGLIPEKRRQAELTEGIGGDEALVEVHH